MISQFVQVIKSNFVITKYRVFFFVMICAMIFFIVLQPPAVTPFGLMMSIFVVPFSIAVWLMMPSHHPIKKAAIYTTAAFLATAAVVGLMPEDEGGSLKDAMVMSAASLILGPFFGALLMGASMILSGRKTETRTSSQDSSDHSRSETDFAGTDYSKFKRDHGTGQHRHGDTGQEQRFNNGQSRKQQSDFAADFDFEEETDGQSTNGQPSNHESHNSTPYGTDKWHRDDIKFMNVINDPNASDAEREMAFKAMMRQQASRRKKA